MKLAIEYNLSTSPRPLTGKTEGEKICRPYENNNRKKFGIKSPNDNI
nr:MAG TPA: hypothetical protein [Caudoviricetes sp.]